MKPVEKRNCRSVRALVPGFSVVLMLLTSCGDGPSARIVSTTTAGEDIGPVDRCRLEVKSNLDAAAETWDLSVLTVLKGLCDEAAQLMTRRLGPFVDVPGMTEYLEAWTEWMGSIEGAIDAAGSGGAVPADSMVPAAEKFLDATTRVPRIA